MREREGEGGRDNVYMRKREGEIRDTQREK